MVADLLDMKSLQRPGSVRSFNGLFEKSLLWVSWLFCICWSFVSGILSIQLFNGLNQVRNCLHQF